MPGYSTIEVERAGAVDWLTLNRPESLNALNDDMVRELWDYFSGLQEDYTCRIVVLRGAGKGFCSGLDLREFRGPDHAIPATSVVGPVPSLADLLLKMRSCPQPIVALIKGAACGGGFSLALASDIRIAGRSAKMNVAYVKLGLSGCELGTSYFLPRNLGGSLAAELMMTGRFIHADRALATGLVSELVEDDALDEAGKALVDDLLAASPIGLRKTKETIAAASGIENLAAVMAIEECTQLACMRDPAFEQAIAAFAGRPRVGGDQNTTMIGAAST